MITKGQTVNRKVMAGAGLLAIMSLMFLVPIRAISSPSLEVLVTNGGTILYENENVSLGQSVVTQVQNGQIHVTDSTHSGLYPITSVVNQYPKVGHIHLTVSNGGVILYEDKNVGGQGVVTQVQNGQIRVTDFTTFHSALYPITSVVQTSPTT